jgi:hypothetical protein
MYGDLEISPPFYMTERPNSFSSCIAGAANTLIVYLLNTYIAQEKPLPQYAKIAQQTTELSLYNKTCWEKLRANTLAPDTGSWMAIRA